MSSGFPLGPVVANHGSVSPKDIMSDACDALVGTNGSPVIGVLSSLPVLLALLFHPCILKPCLSRAVSIAPVVDCHPRS